MNLLQIETPRMRLTGISHEEMAYIFEHFPKPEIKKILGHRSEEEYQKEESKHKNGYSSYNRRFKLFLLADKETGTIIGRCGLHNWNPDHSRAEIGYIMEDEAYKGKRLMAEALGAVLEYGFNTLNLNRIEALVGSNNTPSLKLMEKYRFTKEGVMKQHYYIGGQYEDFVVFARLYEDYAKEDGATLQ